MLKSSTKHLQEEFARFCRDGAWREIEGARPERLPKYRQLIFNIVRDALSTAYPIAVKYLGDEKWRQLCHEFFSNHGCSDPQVWRMPQELIGYVQENEAWLEEFPALVDLLRFEWQEIELFMMPDRELPPHNHSAPKLDEIPVIETEMQALVLQYPVHKMQPSDLNQAQPGTYISLAWRSRIDGIVHFKSISAFYALCLEYASEGSTLRSAGMKAALAVGLSDSESWQTELMRFMDSLHQSELIFGPSSEEL